MNTKLRFNIIASLIIIALAGVIISQAYWLRGFYDRIWDQTERTVLESMKIADYKEIFFRIEEQRQAFIKQKQAEGEEDPTFSKSFTLTTNDGTTVEELKEMEEDEEENQMYMSLDEEETAIESLIKYLAFLEEMEDVIMFNMRTEVDADIPPNYSRYDSILIADLQDKGIKLSSMLEVVNKDIDTVHIAGVNNLTGKKINFHKDIVIIDYRLQVPEDIYYRLTLKSPGQVVLRQMFGIIATSFLLILMVVIAFVYLLRTILRQKTIEEIKTDFVNNVTHELKTPIAVAFAANDAMLNYNEDTTPKQKKYLRIIGEQLEHLTGLVEQILTLSQENRTTFRLNPVPVKVAELIPSLIEQQKLKTKKQVDIQSYIPNDLTIIADRTHLYNILSNLVENAIKYSDKDPVIVTIRSEKINKGIQLSVEDNGIGISEADQKRIFDKFYRVPQGNLHNIKGYGLGLYYIQDIMSKHNGTVSVKSQPGKGSVFTLRFNEK